MKLTHRLYRDETDYARIRAFLRKIHLLNNRIEKTWPVARLDYWRWHVVLNCEVLPAFEPTIHIWEDENGKIAAVLNPEGAKEAHLNIHPAYQNRNLETEMIIKAEEALSQKTEAGTQKLYVWVDEENNLRKEILAARGYQAFDSVETQHYRELNQPLPPVPTISGYTIRSLGGEEELPARSWASWRAFHPDDPDENYEGWTWYRSIQNCPLYRRDLDIVAEAADGSIAAFCTLWYDDVTQTGYFEPVGTVPEHQRRGLGKAVMLEAMHRLKAKQGLVAMVGGYSTAANKLYDAVAPHGSHRIQAWLKEW